MIRILRHFHYPTCRGRHSRQIIATKKPRRVNLVCNVVYILERLHRLFYQGRRGGCSGSGSERHHSQFCHHRFIFPTPHRYAVISVKNEVSTLDLQSNRLGNVTCHDKQLSLPLWKYLTSCLITFHLA